MSDPMAELRALERVSEKGNHPRNAMHTYTATPDATSDDAPPPRATSSLSCRDGR